MHSSIVDSHKKLLEPGSSNVGCEVRLVAEGTEICDPQKINQVMSETEYIFISVDFIITMQSNNYVISF